MREHCWQRHRFIWSRLFRHFDHECWQILFPAAFTPTQICTWSPAHPRRGQRCLSQVWSHSILRPVTAGLGSHRHRIINTFNWRLLTFMAFREKCFQFSRSPFCPGQANPIRQYFTLYYVFVLACSNSDYDFMMSTLCCSLTSLASLWFTIFVVFTVYTLPDPRVCSVNTLAAPTWVWWWPFTQRGAGAASAGLMCSYGGAGYQLARRPHSPTATDDSFSSFPLHPRCHWPSHCNCVPNWLPIFALIHWDVDLNLFLYIWDSLQF